MLMINEETGEPWIHCDFCLEKYCRFTEEWLKHYSYAKGPNDVQVACGKCIRTVGTGGKLIKGVGRMTRTEVQQIENEQREVARQARRSRPSVEELESMMDFTAIEQQIREGTCRNKNLAETYGADPSDIKTALVNRFGNNIEFRRGRNGGIFWVENSNES